MKLLFDQNLSFKLCQALVDLFPGSAQVRLLRLEEADDRAVWQYAKMHAFVLVTQDSDFADMAGLYGHPPKVIWLLWKPTNSEDRKTSSGSRPNHYCF